jgi:hypothetical protein
MQAAARATAQEGRLGIPGAYPGRVVAVRHGGSLAGGKYQAEPVREMVERGIMALTGAPSAVEGWKRFFAPGDVVGIKVNPVGRPHLISAPEVLHPVLAGLEAAGVKRRDIVVYDRYRREFLEAGFD